MTRRRRRRPRLRPRAAATRSACGLHVAGVRAAASSSSSACVACRGVRARRNSCCAAITARALRSLLLAECYIQRRCFCNTRRCFPPTAAPRLHFFSNLLLPCPVVSVGRFGHVPSSLGFFFQHVANCHSTRAAPASSSTRTRHSGSSSTRRCCNSTRRCCGRCGARAPSSCRNACRPRCATCFGQAPCTRAPRRRGARGCCALGA